MLFGWYVRLEGAAKLWVASIVFLLVGSVIGFYLPHLIRSQSGADEAGAIACQLLGGVFMGLGGVVFTLMVVGLFVGRRSPDQKRQWEHQINFLGGLAGALLFAVPATLVLPGLYLASRFRPDLISPQEFLDNFPIAVLFSCVGVISLVGLLWLLRRS